MKTLFFSIIIGCFLTTVGCKYRGLSLFEKKSCSGKDFKTIYAFEVIDTIYALPLPFFKKVFISGYTINADTDNDGKYDLKINFDKERFSELTKKGLPRHVELDVSPKPKNVKLDQKCILDCNYFPNKDQSAKKRNEKPSS
ncbi:hypothetical protein A2645_01610 [Candidatus Nomurabacteria bacterium RIFCSPHIGHO2_01_FULL_39_9]|uniref:Lipoprotein n=1 Tax=Candidatus Nomurabacteria bacterium RIFCSPHIGHO2_01_FULL_39_9 TaxID=1801735 RepID=A0A1F6UUT2_9BACT|nr:MAG: hypothetical protein A2645_01610 [Candidatus Nomurabacteria bacterium RIFCSPHIGHO2_01_FULL_39_9]